MAWCSPPVMLAACSDSPDPHLPERLEAGADHVRRGLVHAEEDRVVVAAEADLELGGAGVAGALDRLDQGGVVDGGDLVEAGQRGRDDAQPLPPVVTPSSCASCMVRSTRIGDIGWCGPKS